MSEFKSAQTENIETQAQKSQAPASKPSFIEGYEADLRKAQASLQKMLQLAESLSTKQAPQPVSAAPFGYCADASMIFDLPGQSLETLQPLVAQLLEAYPPMALVDLPHVRTQKPLEYLREEEKFDTQRELYPVVFKHEAFASSQKDGAHRHSARWWTRLPVGVVEVSVKNAPEKAFDIPLHAYEPDSFTYATGSQSMYRRRMLDVPLGIPAGVENWLQPLEDFAKSLSSPGARAVVNAVRDNVLLGRAQSLTKAMLQNISSVAYNPYRALNPQNYLSEAQADELVKLARATDEALVQGLAQVKPGVEASVEKAAEFLKELLSGFSGAEDVGLVQKALQQRISQEVGQGVQLVHLNINREGRCYVARVQVSLGRMVSPVFQDVTVYWQADKPQLTVARIGVQYVPI